jgi:hypothetical protein
LKKKTYRIIIVWNAPENERRLKKKRGLLPARAGRLTMWYSSYYSQ